MSCEIKINGLSAMVEQPRQKTYSLKNGHTVTRTWEGPSDFADPLFAQLIDGGAETISSDNKGGHTVIRATFGDANGGGSVSNTQNKTWGFSENIFQRPLEQMPYYNTSTDLSNVVSNVYHKIEKENVAPKDIVLASIEGYSALDAGNQTKVQNYLQQRRQGVDSYEEHIPVITLTITQSRRNPVKASLTNCNKKVAYADIGLPGDVPWDEPKYQNGASPASYEWLKGYPSIEFDGLRSTINQSWQGFEKLSAIMYGGTATP